MTPATPEVERRALALLERLAAWPGNARFRRRLLAREPAAVLARVAALEARLDGAAARLPTQLPGTGQSDDDAPPPARVGPFRLLEHIGQGGMGSVWRGIRDDGLYEQQVAIKLIHPRLAARASAAFDAERRILARLEHPGIARLIDGGVAPADPAGDTLDDAAGDTAAGNPRAPARPYLVMEFVDGAPVDEALRNAAPAVRVAVFVRAAEAVQFAHGRLVAHADLKPLNILVDTAGQVKLLDFGIARLLGEAEVGPDPRPMTPAFASPERIAGDGPSIADDVFALGRTLIHVLTAGQGGDGAAAEGAEPSTEMIADAELAAIARMASAPRAAKRYASVAALVADLAAWQAQRPVAAMHGGRGYRPRRFVARHRLGVTAAALAFALLAATTIVAVTNYLRAEQARAEAIARYAAARATLARLQQDATPNGAAAPSAAIALDTGVTVGDLQRRVLAAEATVRGWQGRYAEMAAAAAAALRMPPAADPRDAVLHRAAMLGMLAEAAFYRRQIAAAVRDYGVQAALLEAAHRRWPDDNILRSRLAQARWNLGTTHTEGQAFTTAEPILRDGVTMARTALAFDPADQDAVRQLRIIATAHAQVLGQLRRTDEALEILVPIVDDDRARAHGHPAETLRQRDYAVSLAMLGEVLDAGGRAAAGCRADAEAHAVYAALRRAGRLTPLELDHNIALLDARLARACGNQRERVTQATGGR